MVLHYKEKKSGIYSIINTVNGKIYIGKTINLYHRKYQHFALLNSHRHTNEHLNASAKKYGADKFYYNVVEYCDESILGEREHYWIKHFDSNNRDKGYNIDVINEDGTTKRDWSSSKKMSETIKKNGGRKALMGADNPTSKTVYQYSLDGEYLNEFGGAHEAARVLGLPDMFTRISHVARKKIGQSLGYQWRYEKLDRIDAYVNKLLIAARASAERLRKPIVAIDLETGEETIYNSILEASNILGLALSALARIARGERKFSKKLNMTFKYLNPDDLKC
jgi:group I intron endonuclease